MRRGSRGVVPPDYRVACVYKPIAGERPLWDFPMGTLAGREVAAYAVSRAAGWDVVPPTVMRDGPFGPGMCQLWIDHDTDVDLIALSRRADHAGLRDMAVFDAVVNNADRKIGHLLPVADGHLYGCDHGVCFAEDYKLRTVLWQWRGKSLPRRSVEALRRLNTQLTEGGLEAELSWLLTASEIRPLSSGSRRCSSTASTPTRPPTGPPSPGRRSSPGQPTPSGSDTAWLPGAAVAPEVALEFAGDRVAARLGQVHRVLGLFEGAHVVGDLGVLLGQLVHAALPGARLLGQVGQRQRRVQDVLDAAQQRQRGLRARRLRHVVRDLRP